MPMDDEEKIKAVTAKLTGEFYVGQRVRVKQTFTVRSVAGRESTIEAISRGVVHLRPPLPAFGPWHPSNIEPA